jgi:hypothetical protein
VRKLVASVALATVFVAGSFLGSVPAKATTYNFSFAESPSGQIVSSPDYSVTGQIFTGSADGPGFDVTGITGSITGPNLLSISIASLYTANGQNATPPLFNTQTGVGYTYDNILLTSAPFFTATGGLLFTSNTGDSYEFYASNGLTYLSTTDFGGCPSTQACNPGVSGTFALTATPLPAALPLFASGLGALGLLGWRRKRKNAAAFAA